MARAGFLKSALVGVLTIPPLVGCAALQTITTSEAVSSIARILGPKNAYRLTLDPVVTHGQFAIIQNFGAAEIVAAQVDSLLAEVADLLGVALDPSVRKVRIVVTAPDIITALFSSMASTARGNARAEALYVPKTSLVLIPYFDRLILGHELAHYVTEHYLGRTPLAEWEAIAEKVEWKLLTSRRRQPLTTVAR